MQKEQGPYTFAEIVSAEKAQRSFLIYATPKAGTANADFVRAAEALQTIVPMNGASPDRPYVPDAPVIMIVHQKGDLLATFSSLPEKFVAAVEKTALAERLDFWRIPKP